MASTGVLLTVGGLVSIFGRKSILVILSSVSPRVQGFLVRHITCPWRERYVIRQMDGDHIVFYSHIFTHVAIRGFGGGCLAGTEIIYADLFLLTERGKFLGIIAS